MPLPDTPRSFVVWSLAHGVQRMLIRRGVRKGDVLSKLSIDPATAAEPFAAYELLRSAPLVHNGYFAGTVDHAVANEILRSEDFGTGGGHGELPPLLRRVVHRVVDPDTLGPVDPPSMLVVDPPQHTRYRKLVSRSFTARKVGRMGERVEAVADRLLDDLGREPSFDLVERYAALLPVAVIGDLLGVREEDRDQLLHWGNLAAITLDPALRWREFRAAEEALRAMHGWFREHVARLRREPGDDLLSQLILGDEVDQLTEAELHQVGLLVLGAGFETTVNLIGNAVALLDAHPDQLAQLRHDPDGWANAVEEVLRLDSPVQLTLRVALRDVEVGGRELKQGEAVLVFLGGANRDPAVFDYPTRFDVRRPNAHEHLGFSAGIHFCLGASLARLEAAVALRKLYERFPDLRVDGRPERRGTRVLRGWEHLPVTTRARVNA